MHALLMHEFGQGVDIQRLLKEPLYARDVLLVCDALRDSDLSVLAQQFRAADDVDAGASQGAENADEQPSIWPKSWVKAGRWLSK